MLYYLSAIGILKQDVENLTELDKSAELLVRLLCAVPGWSEKNVQVCITPPVH
jgi:cytoskeleton-associated protein 5